MAVGTTETQSTMGTHMEMWKFLMVKGQLLRSIPGTLLKGLVNMAYLIVLMVVVFEVVLAVEVGKGEQESPCHVLDHRSGSWHKYTSMFLANISFVFVSL